MPTHPTAASALFLAAIVADALGALLDPRIAAPATLRGTGLVLAACFSAPVLCNPKRGVHGAWQRPLIGACLLLAAMLGLHTGDTGVRAADALYTLLVGYSCVWLFGAGGVDEQGKSADPNALEHAVRASASMLSAGLLLYASLRVLRAGLVHAAEVDGAVVAPAAHLAGNVSASGPRFTARAYAHASETSTLSAAFGGSVGIGAALVLAANAPHLRFGLEAVSLQLAVGGPRPPRRRRHAAAEQQTQLPTLGAGTCAGAAGDCSAAAEGRRFAVANTPSDALWLLALGLAVLALPTRRRRAGAALGAIADGSVPWGAALFGVLVVFVAALVHCTFVGPQAYVDAVALAVLGGAAWALAVDLWSGAAVGAIGYVVFLVLASEELGPCAVFSQLTNVSLACLVGALVLLLLLDATTLLCVFGWYPTARAVLAVAGTSIALLLLLASSCLTLAYSGQLFAENATGLPPARQALKWLLQHQLPLLAWAPVFATAEVGLRVLSPRVYRLVWIGAAVDVAIVYAIVLAALGVEAPALAYVDAAPFAVAAGGVAVVPWLLCGRL